MNKLKYLVSFFAIISFLLLSSQISIADTNSEAEADEINTFQVTPRPYKESTIFNYVLGAIAVNFAKLGNFDRALEIAKPLNESSRWPILRDIARELVADGQVEKALELSNNQDNTFHQGLVVEGVVRELGNQGELTSALAITESIEEDFPKILAATNLALTLIKAEKFAEGMEATQFLASSIDTSDPRKTDYLQTIGLEFSSAKQFKSALKVVEILDVQSENGYVGTVAYELRSSVEGGMAISQAEDGNIKEALKMAESLRALNRVAVFSNVAKALVKSGNIDEALALAQSLKNRLIVELVMGGIAVALAEEGDTEKAVELASSFSSSRRAYTITDIAHTLVERGEIDKAVKLTKLIPDQSSWLSVSVATKLAEKGKIEEAMIIAQSLGEFEKNSILASVITSVAEQGNIEKAKEMMASFEQEQIGELGSAIIDLGARGSLEPAQELAQLLPNNLLKAAVLAKIAGSYIEAGEKQQATILLNQAFSVEMMNIDGFTFHSFPWKSFSNFGYLIVID